MMKKSLNILLVAFVALFAFSTDVFAYCPLGPDVTKDLSGLLKIINYAAPLLCIVFSVIDVLKTLTKGDAMGNTRPVVNRFLKRLLYTVILFFIPVLVDQFMIMAGVWDEDGGCSFDASENGSNGQEDSGLTGTVSYVDDLGNSYSINW